MTYVRNKAYVDVRNIRNKRNISHWSLLSNKIMIKGKNYSKYEENYNYIVIGVKFKMNYPKLQLSVKMVLYDFEDNCSNISYKIIEAIGIKTP